MAGVFLVLSKNGSLSSSQFNASFDSLRYRGEIDVKITKKNVGIGILNSPSVKDSGPSYKEMDGREGFIIMDGTLYNKERLNESWGRKGTTHDGVDLVYKLYKEYGIEFLEYIHGPFSIIICDWEDDRVVFARDRVGRRHLYYTDTERNLILSSELRPIVEYTHKKNQPDYGFLGEYLSFKSTHPTATFYEGIKRVSPGNYGVFDWRNTHQQSYWNISNKDSWILDRDRIPDEKSKKGDYLYDLLKTAITDATLEIADPSVSMSGGLDSSSIACILGNRFGSVTSYSLTGTEYHDDYHAEEARIDLLGEERNIELNKVEIDKGLLPLSDLDFYKDSLVNGPCLNQLGPANSALYQKAASDGKEVLITGEGGNIHNGSRVQYANLLSSLEIKALMSEITSDPEPNANLMWYLVETCLPLIFREINLLNMHYTPPSWMSDSFVFKTDLHKRTNPRGKMAEINSLSNQWIANMFVPTRDFEMDYSRQRSLRDGIEQRHPLLDPRLVEFVYSLDSLDRFRSGQEKVLFREAVSSTLPDEIRTVDETPAFDPIVQSSLEASKATVKDLLSETILSQKGIVSQQDIEKVIAEYYDENGIRIGVLWRLITSEMWLNTVSEHEELRLGEIRN